MVHNPAILGSNQKIGKKGEELARNFLLNKGFKILELNFKSKYGEVDIIAEKDFVLFFVEVKTRRNENFGKPYESIGAKKQRKIAGCALNYLKLKKQSNYEVRFGIVSILLYNDLNFEIEWLEDDFDSF